MSTQVPNVGYTNKIADISKTFHHHRRLLLFLAKLNILTNQEYYILQSDFEHKTWTSIRDGDHSWLND